MMKSIATLLGCAIGLIALPSSGHATQCWVTLVTTDLFGIPDWTTAHRAVCRDGESSGGVEYYNPYTKGFTFSPGPPIDTNPHHTSGGGSGETGMGGGGSGGGTGTYSGSDNSTITVPACTPVPSSSKIRRHQLPPDQHWCSSKPGGLGP